MSESHFGLAVKKVREDGFVSLLLTAPRYIAGYVASKVPTRLRRTVFHPITDALLEIDSLTREEVQQQCAEQGKLWEYDDPQVKKRVLSQYDDSDPNSRARREGHDLSPRKVCELTDAAMLEPQGLVMNSEGKFIDESLKPKTLGSCASTERYLRGRNSILFQIRAIKHQKGINLSLRNPPRFETAMSMVTYLGNYGHWLLEYLPMLLHLSVYEDATGRKPDIIIDSDPEDWKLETLRILGYPEDRLVEWNNNFAEIDRLVLPLSSGVGHSPGMIRMSPVEYRWLRDRFLESVDDTDTTAEERFYISRQGIDNRRVTNFKEIRSVLEEFDIEVVRPEEMSVEEQVRKFSRGDLFVGPQGSGLHNTLFAEDAKVIEIFHPEVRQHYQYSLDKSLGHDYRSMFGSVDDPLDGRRKKKNRSFKVNPQSLRLKIEQTLSDTC